MTKLARKAELKSKYKCFGICAGLLIMSAIPTIMPAKESAQEVVEQMETEIIQWKEESTEEVSVEPLEDTIVTEPEPETQEPVIKETEWQTHISKEYISYVEEICESQNICPAVVIALIEAESDGNPNDVSKNGAIGLMQVVPKWHWERMEKLGVTDLFDPYSNILTGVDYLDELRQDYDDLPVVLMCYNEGPDEETLRKIADGYVSDYAKKIIDRASELQRMKERAYE